MESKKIWLMCGIAGSGKSTWIKNNIQGENASIISRDLIRKSLIKNNEAYFSKEDLVFDLFRKAIQSALNSLSDNIYIDATHVSKGSRKKILSQLNFPEGTELNVVWLNTDIKKCLARNEKRTGFEYVPKSSIKRMAIQFDVPTEEEFERYNFSKVNIVEVKR